MISIFNVISYLAIGIALLVTLVLMARRFQRGPKRIYNVDLKGQVVVITGCSAGIGKETAREIAKTNATIIFACRDEQKTRKVMAQIQEQTKNKNLVFMKLDLPNYDSVKEFSVAFHQQYQKLNILINNAGIGFPVVQKDAEGHDMNFKTNYMGHFLLTHLLMDLIVSTKKSRVVNVSSAIHALVKRAVDFEQAYHGSQNGLMVSYATSKYANVLFTNHLQKLFDEKNIETKAVSLHPGGVNTEMFQKSFAYTKFLKFILFPIRIIFSLLVLQESEGAWTTNYTALQPYEELKPAGYYEKNGLSRFSEYVLKFDQAKELWDFSLKELKIKSII